MLVVRFRPPNTSHADWSANDIARQFVGTIPSESDHFEVVGELTLAQGEYEVRIFSMFLPSITTGIPEFNLLGKGIVVLK